MHWIGKFCVLCICNNHQANSDNRFRSLSISVSIARFLRDIILINISLFLCVHVYSMELHHEYGEYEIGAETELGRDRRKERKKGKEEVRIEENDGIVSRQTNWKMRHPFYGLVCKCFHLFIRIQILFVHSICVCLCAVDLSVWKVFAQFRIKTRNCVRTARFSSASFFLSYAHIGIYFISAIPILASHTHSHSIGSLSVFFFSSNPSN